MKFHPFLLLITLFTVQIYQTDSKIRKKVVTQADIAEQYEKGITLRELNNRKCKTLDRYIQPNCKCIDGFYDNGINDKCQICPYPCLTCENSTSFCQTCNERPYLSLQHFISKEKLEKLEDYILNEFKLFDDKNRLLKNAEPFRPGHGHCILLHSLKKEPKNFNFYLQRKYRGSNYYYPPNPKYNMTELKQFVVDLDFFEFTGFQFMIYNTPGDKGSPHHDHEYDDIIGEFMWVSPNTAKQFYIEYDNSTEKNFVTSNIAWFDDKLLHSIAPSDRPQITYRVNGKFKPWIRQYILDNYSFVSEDRRKLFQENQTKLRPCPEELGCYSI